MLKKLWNLCCPLNSEPIHSNPAASRALSGPTAGRLVKGLQAVFLIIALFQLNAPFVSYHNERQNQTFDTARHVFNEGWSAIVTPKTSFSLPGYEARSYTVARQEFPFHGLLGWPLVKLFGHPVVVVRLVSIIFALLSIQLLYLILRQWLAPGAAVTGAALWTFSPLLLHLGQVPMPDILCTTGMLAAFWLATKNQLPASSVCFLFSVLAKISVIVFGLPILVALLVARNCRRFATGLWIAIGWGLLPLVGLMAWLSLEFFDPDTPWTVAHIISERGGAQVLFTARFYAFVFVCLFPYGLGFMGALGCAVALIKKCAPEIKPAVKWALLAANFFYLLFVVSKIQEPQYLLPALAWWIVSVAFGWRYLVQKLEQRPAWRVGLAVLVGLQTFTAIFFTCDLKSSRVPDYAALESAAATMPVGGRVIVAYPFYGASPAVWLNHSVFAVNSITVLTNELPRLEKMGFTHLVLMDVKSRSRGAGKDRLINLLASLVHLGRPEVTTRDPLLSDYARPDSPFRQYGDAQFTPIFSSDYIIVYALPPLASPDP